MQALLAHTDATLAVMDAEASLHDTADGIGRLDRFDLSKSEVDPFPFYTTPELYQGERDAWKRGMLNERKIKHPKWGMNKPRVI
jgi:hypothetical protein